MVLDAIDQYLDALTGNLVIMNISCSEKIRRTIIKIQRNFKFTWKPVYICKLRHEDNPTTKEDFFKQKKTKLFKHVNIS